MLPPLCRRANFQFANPFGGIFGDPPANVVATESSRRRGLLQLAAAANSTTGAAVAQGTAASGKWKAFAITLFWQGVLFSALAVLHPLAILAWHWLRRGVAPPSLLLFPAPELPLLLAGCTGAVSASAGLIQLGGDAAAQAAGWAVFVGYPLLFTALVWAILLRTLYSVPCAFLVRARRSRHGCGCSGGSGEPQLLPGGTWVDLPGGRATKWHSRFGVRALTGPAWLLESLLLLHRRQAQITLFHPSLVSI